MVPNKGRVTAIVGAQYGSEGKGAIVAHIADLFDIHLRTGGPNAGHTFYWDGQAHVMQTIPCGWANKHATCVIGRGALIDPDQFLREIDHIEGALPGSSRRVIIDAHAGIIDNNHYEEEGGTKGALHKRMGSTGKGVGAARRDRMSRDPQRFRFVYQHPAFEKYVLNGQVMDDTASWLHSQIGGGRSCLLEGAQGSGLSLTFGYWPYVTSSDTNAATMAADAGIPPQWVDDVILVARTYPIRVAGNSGPLANETTWEKMSQQLNRSVTEKTTVTKLVRRIGEWDDSLFGKAVKLNGAKQVALTFVDYLGSGTDYACDSWDHLSDKAQSMVYDIEEAHGVHVRWIKTGPKSEHIIERPCPPSPQPF